MELNEAPLHNKYLVSLTKIISIYSFFLVLIKSIAILRGAWLVPNVILIIPFIALGVTTAFAWANQKYQWWLGIAGAIIIIVFRYYEVDWTLALQERFGN